MDDFSGFDPYVLDLIRQIGVSWIGAFFMIGMMILGGRWLLNWQLRRIERIVKEKDAQAAKALDGSSAKAGSAEG
jgi:hypothetical protein